MHKIWKYFYVIFPVKMHKLRDQMCKDLLQ